MELSLGELLREARSLPVFTGTDGYGITSYLRDVDNLLSLSSAENIPAVQSVLTNKLQGRAKEISESLLLPTYDIILAKLKLEFGVKQTFLSLRTDAMNVQASNIEELHEKLQKILHLMNTKYVLEGQQNNLYTPRVNDQIIFEVYTTFLPLHIKSLLLQNNIDTIDSAYHFYLETNILKDLKLKIVGKSNFQNANQTVRRNENQSSNSRYNNNFIRNNGHSNRYNNNGQHYNNYQQQYYNGYNQGNNNSSGNLNYNSRNTNNNSGNFNYNSRNPNNNSGNFNYYNRNFNNNSANFDSSSSNYNNNSSNYNSNSRNHNNNSNYQGQRSQHRVNRNYSENNGRQRQMGEIVEIDNFDNTSNIRTYI